eukprot:7391711-Prymnesium_polylepis.2
MKQNEMIVCPVEGKCSRIDLDVACGAWEDAFDVHLGYLSVCQRLQRLRHAGRRGAPVCRPKLQDRCSHLWCQARRIEAKCIYHPTFELVNPARKSYLRSKTFLTILAGDTECARATRRIVGSCPSNQSPANPATSSKQTVVSPKKIKNRYTPAGPSGARTRQLKSPATCVREISACSFQLCSSPFGELPNPKVTQIAWPTSVASRYARATDDMSHALITRTHM